MVKKKPAKTYPSHTKEKEKEEKERDIDLDNFNTEKNDTKNDTEKIIHTKKAQISSLLSIFSRCGLNYSH